MEPNKVVVVGSQGFIGRSTVNKLEDLGHNVLGVTSENQNQLIERSFWQEIQPSHIVWLASRITPSLAHNNPDLVREELDEFQLFIESLKGIPTQIIFASSGGTVYTDELLPFSESSKAYGANEYGKSKLAMEQALNASGVASTILRISNAYGPGQRLNRGQGVIGTWLSEIMHGNPITVFGSLENVRDFIFIDDVVDAIIASINYSTASETFNIGSGLGVSLQTVIEGMRNVTGIEFSINQLEGRSVDRAYIWLNIEKAYEKLLWIPANSLNDGLKMTWDSLFRARQVK